MGKIDQKKLRGHSCVSAFVLDFNFFLGNSICWEKLGSYLPLPYLETFRRGENKKLFPI